MPKTARDPADLLPLTPVVLHILLTLARDELHGYAIAQEVERDSGGQIRMGPGTLYGSIQRMQHAGLIEPSAHRNGDDDPRRRYYRVTPFGRRVLAMELARIVDVARVARTRHLLADA